MTEGKKMNIMREKGEQQKRRPTANDRRKKMNSMRQRKSNKKRQPEEYDQEDGRRRQTSRV